jgi:prepilin peptidase CpaA
MQASLVTILVAASGWAVVTDLRQRRIPNWLTLGTAGAALAARLATGGGQSLLAGVEGWLLGAALMFVPFAFRWMGAGDVKLLAAFGALGGPLFVCQTALAGSLAGGLLALFYLARERNLLFFIWHVFVQVRHLSGGVSMPGGLVKRHQRIPYAPALALGAVGTLALGMVAH